LVGEENRQRQERRQRRNAGILRCAQNDDVKRTQQEQGQQQEQKQQHRPGKIGGREAGFSATQLAKARAAPVEMTILLVDEREQATAKAGAGWVRLYIPTLCDETAKDGAPVRLGLP
jgi:hypothetical protein